MNTNVKPYLCCNVPVLNHGEWFPIICLKETQVTLTDHNDGKEKREKRILTKLFGQNDLEMERKTAYLLVNDILIDILYSCLVLHNDFRRRGCILYLTNGSEKSFQRLE